MGNLAGSIRKTPNSTSTNINTSGLTGNKKRSLSNDNAAGGDQFINKSGTENIEKDFERKLIDCEDNKNQFLIEKDLNQFGDQIKEKLLDQTLNETFNVNILPDIINVQPAITEKSDESIISSLTKDLNHLQLDTPKKNNTETSKLALPKSTIIFDGHSSVSSDDEYFAECQGFNETDLLDSTKTNQNPIRESSPRKVDPLIEIKVEEIIRKEEISFVKEAKQQIPVVKVEPLIDSGLDKVAATKVERDNLPVKVEFLTDAKEDVVTHQQESPPIKVEPLIGSGLDKVEVGKHLEKESLPVKAEIVTESNAVVAKEHSLNLHQTIDISNQSFNSDTNEESLLNKTENLNLNSNKSQNSIELNQTFDNNDKALESNQNLQLSGSLELTQTAEILNLTIDIPSRNENILNRTFDSAQLNNTFSKDLSLVPRPIEKSIVEVKEMVVKSPDQLEKCNEKNNAAKRDKIPNNTLNVTLNINKSNEVEPMDVDELPPSPSPSLTQQYINNDLNDAQKVKNSSNMKRSPFRKLPPLPSKEQDVFVEDFIASNIDIKFKTPQIPSQFVGNKRRSQENQIQMLQQQQQFKISDEEFQSSLNGLILNPSDFDFLLSKGNDNISVDRSSLLLRFDPLLGHSVPVNIQEQIQQLNNNNNQLVSTIETKGILSQAIEEENIPSPNQKEGKCSNSTLENDAVVEPNNISTNVDGLIKQTSIINNTNPIPSFHSNTHHFSSPLNHSQNIITVERKEKLGDVKMSVDVIQDMKIENDVKSIDNIKSDSDEKKDYKMAELEKKIKNESLKTEDIEKKLKDAEQREEALLKRITEKDKTTAKMSGVIEAYEKAIAELIADKEQIIQNYEKQMEEIKSDRDLNYQHLTSLETTFSDLHAKYERSKQITATVKASEESLLAEKKQNLENLRLQEQRYEKMKNHAMQQLEIANNKLESLTKNHSVEITKLKALLKKEEISRLSTNEQLQQKTRENEELMKICDELINGQGS